MMFKKLPQIPLRTFYIELKYRPPDDETGDREELIQVLNLQVPKLKNSDLEKQWVFAQTWNKLCEPEYRDSNINQAFIFTAEGRELLIRLEVNQFTDEPSRKISPPDPTVFEQWRQQVAKRFNKFGGIPLSQRSREGMDSRTTTMPPPTNINHRLIREWGG